MEKNNAFGEVTELLTLLEERRGDYSESDYNDEKRMYLEMVIMGPEDRFGEIKVTVGFVLFALFLAGMNLFQVGKLRFYSVILLIVSLFFLWVCVGRYKDQKNCTREDWINFAKKLAAENLITSAEADYVVAELNTSKNSTGQP